MWPGVWIACSCNLPTLTDLRAPSASTLLHGRKRLDDLELRIVAFNLAGSQHLRGDIARDDFRTADLLQLGDAAGVIVVHVRIQDDLDVVDIESQLLHVLSDQRRRLRQGTVDQHMTLGRRDEDRAQAMHADVVRVAEDPKRRLLLVPGFAALAIDGRGDCVA